MAKLYDNINLGLLVKDAIEHEYPLPMLILALEAYLSPRNLKKGQMIHEGLLVFTGIVAGCSQATSMARFFLYNPMRDCNAMHFSTTAMEFVDDVLVKTIDLSGEV
eukprot:1520266-Heterocapsa_arctica.AAC.1